MAEESMPAFPFGFFFSVFVNPVQVSLKPSSSKITVSVSPSITISASSYSILVRSPGAAMESPVPVPEHGGHASQSEDNETSMMTDF
jgi:hypothetical protein